MHRLIDPGVLARAVCCNRLLHAVSVSLRRRGDCLPSYSGSDVSARQLIIVVVVAVATRRALFLLVVAADRRPPC